MRGFRERLWYGNPAKWVSKPFDRGKAVEQILFESNEYNFPPLEKRVYSPTYMIRVITFIYEE